MYSGDWRERVRQHLYGGGPWRCKPKPWADLVPGYDPGAKTLAAQRMAVRRVIEFGGAMVLWQKRCFYWHVKLRESWFILRIRPGNNIQENLGNPRHVPKWEQERLRGKRDRAAQRWHDDAVMGIRKLPDGSWERYGQDRVWAGNGGEGAADGQESVL